jgi:hypothetical protein
MPLSTSLQCPHCGIVATTKKVILPGTAVRCPNPECKQTIHILPSKVGLVETIPVVGNLPSATIHELFTPDSPPRPAPRGSEVDIRCFTDSNEPLPPRAELPVRTGKKKVLLDGKPPVFHRSRSFIAAMMMAVVVMAGLVSLSFLIHSVVAVEKQAANAGKKRGQQLQNLVAPGKPKEKPKPKAMIFPVAPPPPEGEKRVAAPATDQIGDMVVGVSSADFRRNDDQNPPGEHLSITLRITNRSAKPMVYVSWSQAIMKATLRDFNRNFYNAIKAPPQDPISIEPGSTITDTIEFEAPPKNIELELDLDVPGKKSYLFRIPLVVIHNLNPPAAGPWAKQPPPVVQKLPDPEQDPRICGAVKAAYRSGLERIKKRHSMRSPKAALAKVRSEEPDLVKDLADQFSLKFNQITRILGDTRLSVP